MALFYFQPRIPDDVYTPPKQHTQDELDALRVPMDKRDRCKDMYADFRKCITVVH